MAYQQNVHYLGVDNETNILHMLQDNNKNISDLFDVPNIKYVTIKLGGTQSKSDIRFISYDEKIIINSSIKRKENIKTGSFDYCNLYISKYLKDEAAQSILKDFYDYVDVEKQNIVQNTKVLISKKAKQVSKNFLSNYFDDKFIRKILKDNVLSDKITHYCINDLKTKKLICFKTQQHYLANYVDNNEVEFFVDSKKRSIESKTIFIKVLLTNQIIDTNIRVRVTLNNGVGALLGLSSKNKSSSFTIKLQQDSIDKMLKLTNNIKELSYL